MFADIGGEVIGVSSELLENDAARGRLDFVASASELVEDTGVWRADLDRWTST